MSVLIKDMEMPEHCGYCRFRYDGICHALQKTQYAVTDCPLVEVPDPHGEKTGKWIDHQLGRWVYAKCSKCGSVHDVRSNYCPSCGARMVD